MWYKKYFFFIDMKFGVNQAISQTIIQLSCIQLETPSSRLWNFWWIKSYTTFDYYRKPLMTRSQLYNDMTSITRLTTASLLFINTPFGKYCCYRLHIWLVLCIVVIWYMTRIRPMFVFQFDLITLDFTHILHAVSQGESDDFQWYCYPMPEWLWSNPDEYELINHTKSLKW